MHKLFATVPKRLDAGSRKQCMKRGCCRKAILEVLQQLFRCPLNSKLQCDFHHLTETELAVFCAQLFSGINMV